MVFTSGEKFSRWAFIFELQNGEESVIVSLSPWGTGDAKRQSFIIRQVFLVVEVMPVLALTL